MLNLNFFSTLLIPFKVNQELSKFENVSLISIVMHGVWLELQIRQNKEKKNNRESYYNQSEKSTRLTRKVLLKRQVIVLKNPKLLRLVP